MYHVYTHAQVHPIFVLSIADFMLAMLWVFGGGLWLRRDVNMSRVWCFSASLMTVVSTLHMWCCETTCMLEVVVDFEGCMFAASGFSSSSATNFVIVHEYSRLFTDLE